MGTGGQLLKNINTNAGTSGMQINIGDLQPGIYFISLQNGINKKTFKLIKNGN